MIAQGATELGPPPGGSGATATMQRMVGSPDNEVELSDQGTQVFFLPRSSDQVTPVYFEALFSGFSPGETLLVDFDCHWFPNRKLLGGMQNFEVAAAPAFTLDNGTTWLAYDDSAYWLSLPTGPTLDRLEGRTGRIFYPIAHPGGPAADVIVRIVAQVQTPVDASNPSLTYEGDESGPTLTVWRLGPYVPPSPPSDVTASITGVIPWTP